MARQVEGAAERGASAWGAGQGALNSLGDVDVAGGGLCEPRAELREVMGGPGRPRRSGPT